MNKKHNTEDLWDYICQQVGFNKEGKEFQKAIKLFIKLKIKELKEVKGCCWKCKRDGQCGNCECHTPNKNIEFEELAHAYFEPGDKDYWDGIELAKDYIKKLIIR